MTFEGDVPERVRRFSRVLLCVGRRPNTAGLGLEKTGVQLDPQGFISVDRQRRTGNPRVLAIGDAAGEPMLAHKAAHEGKIAVEVILGKSVSFEPKAIPAVVFTDPEIAWAGLTETEAKRQGRTIEVAQFPWMASGRAQAIGRTEGLTKWIIDPQSKVVVGCGIVGYGAGDLISEAVLAIEMGCTSATLPRPSIPIPRSARLSAPPPTSISVWPPTSTAPAAGERRQQPLRLTRSQRRWRVPGRTRTSQSGRVLELGQTDVAAGHVNDDFELSAERLDQVSQRADLHVVLRLQPRERRLFNAERCSEFLLGQAHRFSYFRQEHLGHHLLRPRLRARKRFRRHLGFKFTEISCHQITPSSRSVSRCASYKSSANGIMRS